VKTWNSLGRSAHYALKLTQKRSFQKKADPLAKQSAYVFHAMFAQNVWSTHLHTMNALEFGADYQSANAVA
jgi:hypothetical protein